MYSVYTNAPEFSEVQQQHFIESIIIIIVQYCYTEFIATIDTVNPTPIAHPRLVPCARGDPVPLHLLARPRCPLQWHVPHLLHPCCA